jgi:uncharacterized membrane protein YagU involved in acid resistance
MTTTFSLESAKHAFTVSKAILWGGLVAGALDATDGVVAFGLQGLNPIQVLQYIASGVLGKAAFSGGLAAAGLGTLLHFFIAFTVAAVYILASQKIVALKAHAIMFGVLVYLVMTFIVLPKSAVAPSPFSLAMFLNGIIGHALFVGLPISFFSRRTAE